MAKLRFLFDYISPYSYLAWQRVPDLAQRHGLVLEPVPVLLAGLLDHHGHKGPGEIVAKRRYVFKDCLRRAAELGVPFRPPHSHPFHPLLVLRVTSLGMASERRAELVTRLFSATWARGLDVSSPEVVGRICGEVGLEDALEAATLPATKQRLKDNTDEALRVGAFGVPTLLVGDELFWGLDSLRDLEAHLAGEDPVAAADLEAWEAVEPSALRVPLS